MSEGKGTDIPICILCPDGEAWQLTHSSHSKRPFHSLCQGILSGPEISQAQSASSLDVNSCHFHEAKAWGAFAWGENPPLSTFQFITTILDNNKGKFPESEGKCFLLSLPLPVGTSSSLARPKKAVIYKKTLVIMMCFFSLQTLFSSADRRTVDCILTEPRTTCTDFCQ